MNLSGKNVIVTGGSNGIGWQIVINLLAKNVQNLTIIDLEEKPNEIDSLRSTLNKTQSLRFYKVDVANRESVEYHYRKIFNEMNGQLNCVINVAGIFNENEIERTLAVNLGGIINSSLSAMKLMSVDNSGNGGIVCNVSSAAAIDHQLLSFMPIYTATKSGVISFTKSMGDNIFYERSHVKFISVCPTATDTTMFAHLHEKLLFPETITNSYRIMKAFKMQNAKKVAKCIVKALEKFENGKTYLIDDLSLINVEFKYHRLTDK